MKLLPSDSVSQEYGRLAMRALGIKLPRSWVETPLAGDTDFGIDYQIQLKNTQNEVEFSFYLQLKGTADPALNKDDTISFSFDCKTLRYYHSQEPLVMVAVVNLKDNLNNLNECPIYYFWLDSDWFDENLQQMSSQKSITIRIPCNQLITIDLDVYEYYKRRVQERLALTDLSKEIEPYTNDLINTVGQLKTVIKEKPFILKIVEENGDEPWVENPEGLFPTQLKKINDLLCVNKVKSAEHLLNEVENQLSTLNNHELAELHYQKGNLYSLKNDGKSAYEAYKVAAVKSDKQRYRIAELESQLRYKENISESDIKLINESINVSNLRSATLKAKCLAFLGDYKGALSLLNENYPENISAKLIILSLNEDPTELDSELAKIEPDSINTEREKFAYYMFATRRSFFKAHHENIDYDKVLPIRGRPDVSVEEMNKAYYLCSKAWSTAKELGYPRDFIFLIDISALTYSYFNDLPTLFSHFDNILEERPEHEEIIHIYLKLLLNNNNYTKLIEISNLAPHLLTLDDKGCVFLANYSLQNYREALNIFKTIYTDLIADGPKNSSLLICIAAEIAERLLETSYSDILRAKLASYPDGEILLSLNKFVNLANHHQDNIEQHVDELYEEYIRLKEPLLIAEHLINHLSPSSVKGAQRLIKISGDIMRVHELSEENYYYLAQAYISFERFDEALELVDKVVSRIKIHSQWHVLKASILHSIGKPGMAIDYISKSIKLFRPSHEALQVYIQLYSQFGLLTQLEEVVLELYSRTADRQDKLNYLSQLIIIYSTSASYNDKRLDAIRLFGKLVNRHDCKEEGRFLSYVLFSSENKNAEELKEWQKRLADYTNNFPESAFLKKGIINTNAGPEQLIESLNKLAGVTPELVELWESNRRSIRNGSLPVPFAMRGDFLSDTRDIFTTWAFANSYPEENKEFKIQHAPQLSQEVFEGMFSQNSSILIEESSLIILFELGILNLFLDQVSEFVLFNSTFQRLSQLSTPLGGGLHNTLPRKILETVHAFRDKLTVQKDPADNIVDSLTQYYSKSKTLLITDDFYIKQLVGIDNISRYSANVFNVILMLAKREVISETDKYNLISRFCEYGIISPSMQINLLADTFNHFIENEEDFNYSSSKFNPVFDKVFSYANKSEPAAQVLFKMLWQAAISRGRLPPCNALLDTFRLFLLRHPVAPLDAMLTNWFIYQCLFTPVQEQTLIISQSHQHNNVWLIYQQMMCKISEKNINELILIDLVVSQLFHMNSDQREQAYQAIGSCFTPGTHLADLFNTAFQQMMYSSSLYNNQWVNPI